MLKKAIKKIFRSEASFYSLTFDTIELDEKTKNDDSSNQNIKKLDKLFDKAFDDTMLSITRFFSEYRLIFEKEKTDNESEISKKEEIKGKKEKLKKYLEPLERKFLENIIKKDLQKNDSQDVKEMANENRQEVKYMANLLQVYLKNRLDTSNKINSNRAKNLEPKENWAAIFIPEDKEKSLVFLEEETFFNKFKEYTHLIDNIIENKEFLEILQLQYKDAKEDLDMNKELIVLCVVALVVAFCFVAGIAIGAFIAAIMSSNIFGLFGFMVLGFALGSAAGLIPVYLHTSVIPSLSQKAKILNENLDFSNINSRLEILSSAIVGEDAIQKDKMLIIDGIKGIIKDKEKIKTIFPDKENTNDNFSVIIKKILDNAKEGNIKLGINKTIDEFRLGIEKNDLFRLKELLNRAVHLHLMEEGKNISQKSTDSVDLPKISKIKNLKALGKGLSKIY